jgi:hypothetical protein
MSAEVFEEMVGNEAMVYGDSKRMDIPHMNIAKDAYGSDDEEHGVFPLFLFLLFFT